MNPIVNSFDSTHQSPCRRITILRQGDVYHYLFEYSTIRKLFQNFHNSLLHLIRCDNCVMQDRCVKQALYRCRQVDACLVVEELDGIETVFVLAGGVKSLQNGLRELVRAGR